MNLVLLLPEDFIESEPGQTEPKTRARLTDRRFQHAKKILKVEKGDTLKVGILNGKMGNATVVDITEKELILDISDLSINPPPPLEITLILALPRPKAFVQILEMVTALGVKQLYIIPADRCEQGFWTSHLLRWQDMKSHLLLGLEQAKDTMMPRVSLRRELDKFLEKDMPEILASCPTRYIAHPPLDLLDDSSFAKQGDSETASADDAIETRPVKVAKHETTTDAAANISENHAKTSSCQDATMSCGSGSGPSSHSISNNHCQNSTKNGIAVIIGPEGGFLEPEVARYEKSGFKRLSLGPRILRVQDAIPVVLARLAEKCDVDPFTN